MEGGGGTRGTRACLTGGEAPNVALGNGVVVLDEDSRIVDVGGVEVDENVHHEEDVKGQVEEVDEGEVAVRSNKYQDIGNLQASN